MTKLFKISKNPNLGLFWVLFAQILAKINFLRKKKLSVFKYTNYLPSSQGSEKTNEPFRRKMLNWWTDRQPDGQC